jgi:hypothetical protein
MPKALSLPYNQASSLLTIMTMAKLGGVRNIQRARVLKLLRAELELFETERKRLLMEEHAVLDEKGNPAETQGGITIKDGKAWTAAYAVLLKSAPIVLEVEKDVDKGWAKLVNEVMTTEMCPELSGEPALHFQEILDAVNTAIGV